VAAAFKALYLSDEHVANPGLGCPMPAIGSDVAREAAEIKTEFTAGFRRALEALAQAKQGDPSERHDAAARELAMLVGAVVLARACDGDTAAGILSACRSA
jgi:TetR/AcrR family transcriptional repressor of nem operon